MYGEALLGIYCLEESCFYNICSDRGEKDG